VTRQSTLYSDRQNVDPRVKPAGDAENLAMPAINPPRISSFFVMAGQRDPSLTDRQD
jgi:hypothetical protein